MKLRFLLIFVLLAVSLPSHAQVVKLRCNDKLAGSSFATTLDIDLINRTVLIVFDSGFPPETVQAEIDDRFVTWKWKGDYLVANRLDRVTGRMTWNDLKGSGWLSAGDCKKLDKGMF